MNYPTPSLRDRLPSVRPLPHAARFVGLLVAFGGWMAALTHALTGWTDPFLLSFALFAFGPVPAAACTAILAVRSHGVNLWAQYPNPDRRLARLGHTVAGWSVLTFAGFAIAQTATGLVGGELDALFVYLTYGVVPSVGAGAALAYSDYRRTTA